MKTASILTLFAVLSTIQAHAQGTVSFANNSASRLTQQDGSFVPGSAGVRVELMFAPDGTDPFLFRSIAVRLGNDAAVGVPAPGLFSGGTRTAPTAIPGAFGLFQVRAWRPIDGPSFDAIIAAGNFAAWLGQSQIMRVDTGDPTTIPPGTPIPLPLSSFCVGPNFCIPEPSVIAIALLGLGALLFRHRRPK